MAPPDGSYDPARTAGLCRSATTDPSMQSYCLTGAALVLRGTTGEGSANAVCATLSGSAEKMCNANSGDSALLVDI